MKERKKNPSLDPLLANYYSQGLEKDRLILHPLERDRTLHILKKRLPSPPAIILDVGGGTGIYAFSLAERGYEVHLIDPIPLHIEQAQAQARHLKTSLGSYTVGDARKIEWKDQSVNVVLFLGPLYHLIDLSDRLQALQEAYRVLKPGGFLFAAGISRFGSLMDKMYKGTIYSQFQVVEDTLRTGVHQKTSENLFFAYLHYPKELKEEVEKSGFKNVSLISVEGPVWHQQTMETLHQDQENWDRLLRLLEIVEAEETILGASAHIMAIANK